MSYKFFHTILIGSVLFAIALATVGVSARTADTTESKDEQKATVPEKLNKCWAKTILARNQTATLVADAAGESQLAFHSTKALAAVRSDGTELEVDQTADSVVLQEAGGELRVENGSFTARIGTAAYKIDDNDFSNLVAQPGTEIKLTSGVKILEKGKLPPNLEGLVEISRSGIAGAEDAPKPVLVKLTTDIQAKPKAVDEIGGISSERLPSAAPPNSLKVNLSAPGIDFADAEIASGLRACVTSANGSKYKPVAIERVSAEAPGSAEIVISLPNSLKSAWAVFKNRKIAVMLVDGRYFKTGDFKTNGYGFAAILAIVVFVLGQFLILAWVTVKKHDDGTRIDQNWKTWLRWFTPSGRPASISLFQIYLWTWVVIAGSAYTVVLTGELLTITPQVLALLGIAGAGSVSARMVAVVQDRTPATPLSEPKFADIFKSDGDFDLYKLQMFLFTVGIALYVSFRIAVDQTFPELDENLLLLLGISNGIYVGSKVASGSSPFRLAEQLDIDLKIAEEAKANAVARVTNLNDRLLQKNQEIRDAQSRNEPTDDLDIEKKAIEIQKTAAEAKVTELEKQIAAKTAARADAINKL